MSKRAFSNITGEFEEDADNIRVSKRLKIPVATSTVLTSDPRNETGLIAYETTVGEVRVYSGGAWRPLNSEHMRVKRLTVDPEDYVADSQPSTFIAGGASPAIQMYHGTASTASVEMYASSTGLDIFLPNTGASFAITPRGDYKFATEEGVIEPPNYTTAGIGDLPTPLEYGLVVDNQKKNLQIYVNETWRRMATPRWGNLNNLSSNPGGVVAGHNFRSTPVVTRTGLGTYLLHTLGDEGELVGVIGSIGDGWVDTAIVSNTSVSLAARRPAGLYDPVILYVMIWTA